MLAGKVANRKARGGMRLDDGAPSGGSCCVGHRGPPLPSSPGPWVGGKCRSCVDTMTCGLINVTGLRPNGHT